MQAPSSTNTQRPDATGGAEGAVTRTTPRLLAGMLMAASERRGGGGLGRGDSGVGRAPGSRAPRRLAGHSRAPALRGRLAGPRDWATECLPSFTPTRCRAGSERATLPPPPPRHPIGPQGLSCRPDLHRGWVSRACPPSASGLCTGLLGLGAALRDLSQVGRVPRHTVAESTHLPRARVFSSPSVPRSPQTQNHTLPALIHSADHPSALKQEPDHAGGTTPLTHSGRAHKTRCPGQLKTPATQGGQDTRPPAAT